MLVMWGVIRAMFRKHIYFKGNNVLVGKYREKNFEKLQPVYGLVYRLVYSLAERA